MGLTDGSVLVADVNGNLTAVLPTGQLRARDPSQMFYDTFDTGLDTTNNWNAAVSAGGGVAAAVSGGNLTLGTGTTANGYSYIQTQPTFRPSAPGWLPYYTLVTIENPVTANTYRFWGPMTVPATPTAAAPLTNAVGFELTTAGKLFAISYAAGTRQVIQDLSAATGNGKQPADANQHKYYTFFRGDLAYFTIDDALVATMTTGSLGPAVNILPMGFIAVAGSSAPASSGVITVGAVFVGDTTNSRAHVLADASFPFRKATIKAASTAAAATDTSLVMAQNPGSPMPVTKDTASSGGITAASSFGAISFSTISSTVPAAGTFVAFTTGGYSAVVLVASGTFTGTIAIEGTCDGTNWFTLNGSIPGIAPQFGFTSDQAIRVPCGALQQVRARALTGASITGTVTITANAGVGPEVTAIVEALPPGTNTIGAIAEVDGFKATYSAAQTAFASAAASTDIFTLTGSATKTIRVNLIQISGTQTVGGTANILVVKRSSANTGGTSTTLTAVAHDSTAAAATATARSYTANPSALGATVGTIRSYRVTLPAAGAATDLFFTDTFGNVNNQSAVLRGTGEVFAINLNGVGFAGGTWSIDITWTEE